MKSFVYILSAYLFTIVPNGFSQTIQIDHTLTMKKIGLMVNYLEDEGSGLDITDIITPEYETLWQSFEKESPGFGYTQSVFWVRVTLHNATSHKKKVYLQENYPLMDSLILYIPKEGFGYNRIETGDQKPFGRRLIKHRTFVFPLTLAANTSQTYYLRFQTDGSMNFVLQVSDPHYFQENAFNEYLLILFFNGIIFIMVFYNFCIFLFLREWVYFYYVLFIADVFICTGILNGTLFQFVFPGHPRLLNSLLPVSTTFAVLTALCFFGEFIDMKQNAPRVYNANRILVFVCTIIFLLTIFLPFRLGTPLSSLSTIIALVYGVVMGLILALKRIRTAYFYFTAWLAFIVGAFSYIAKSFGVLPTNFFTDWSLWIGISAQVTLLSLGLADKINQMRRAFRTLNLNLEEKVAERTTELNDTVDELRIKNQQLLETKDQLWGEMQLAKKIQTALLPRTPKLDGYEICGYMEPADEVGGDYYDIINLDRRNWLVIGDVSGHGVSAGLVMMMVQTAINVMVNKNPDISPCELLTSINKTIYANIKQLGKEKYMSITVLAAHKNGIFQFSGLHQNIMIFRKDTRIVELVETDGFWIGAMEDIQGLMSDNQIQITPGDTMLLFTDGIPEAQLKKKKPNPSRSVLQMFGEEKLADLLRKLGNKTVHEIKNGILSEMKAYYHWNDDITMVVVKRIK